MITPLPSAAKLVLQAIGLSLFWLYYCGNPIPRPSSAFRSFCPAWLGLIGVLALVQLWWVNLFNFMDGADGFAPSQMVLGALGLGLSLFLPPPTVLLLGEAPFALLALVLGAALGVLIFTLPRASMFMGDCGALVLAALVLVLAVEMIRLGYALVQVSVFFSRIADATLTVVSRVVSGRNPFEAHRDHSYQRFILHTQAKALRRDLNRMLPERVRTAALLWLVALNIAVVIPLGLMAIAFDQPSLSIAVHALAFASAGIVRFRFHPVHWRFSGSFAFLNPADGQ